MERGVNVALPRQPDTALLRYRRLVGR
jgi:hypothetical protein